MRNPIRKILLPAGIAAIIALWAAIAPELARQLRVERPIENPDAIIVLAGGAVFRERNRFAAGIYRDGAAKRIFLTNDGVRGGWNSMEQTNLPYFELAKRELIGAGVAEADIEVLPQIVEGTRDEAELIASVAATRGLKRMLIVTSAPHTRRALSSFERAAQGKVEIGIVSPPEEVDRFWWLSRSGWRDVGFEYVKLGYYWLFF